MLAGQDAYSCVPTARPMLALHYNDPTTGVRRRAPALTTKGAGMRLDLSSVAYTLIFAGIAVWATSKLIRA